MTSSRSGNAADARPPPRPSGLRPAGPLAVLLAPYIPQRVCSSLAPCQRAWGPAAKCTPYFLTGPKLPPLRSGRPGLPKRFLELERRGERRLKPGVFAGDGELADEKRGLVHRVSGDGVHQDRSRRVRRGRHAGGSLFLRDAEGNATASAESHRLNVCGLSGAGEIGR